MTYRRMLLPLAIAVAVLAAPRGRAVAEDPARGPATWRQPRAGEVRGRVLNWLSHQKVADAVRRQAAELWPQTPAAGTDLLAQLGATVALVDARAATIVQYSRTGDAETPRPDASWLGDRKLPPLVRSNLRLLLGRRLVQLQYFDEGLEQLDGLEVEEVVDPAALLYYSGVAHYGLLHREQGMAALGRLLERRDELPQRYAALAVLMEADLRQLKDETLDHISRRMDDIRRRLDLGGSGEKVRDEEDGVVKSLDKLIKQLEDQADAAASANSLHSAMPAQDSVPMGGKAPGLVTKKNVGKNNAWGDLPPKERQEAMQEIGRDFPANYRDVIEEYFRELANTKPAD